MTFDSETRIPEWRLYHKAVNRTELPVNASGLVCFFNLLSGDLCVYISS